MASILLHAACALLLARLLMEAGAGRWPAALGALWFALHPVTVESTAWICSLGDVMCGLFSLLAVLLHVRGRWLGAHLALLVALFAKEHAVVVPGLWLAWDLIFRRSRARRWPLLARGPAAGLALCLAFLALRASLGLKFAQVPEPMGGSLATAALTMLAGLGWYAGTVLLPFSPTFDARVALQESLFAAPVLIGLVVLGALLVGLWRGPRRVRLACGWFLIALVPVSNLIAPLKIPTADRFLYLPLMGLAFAMSELIRRTAHLSFRLAPIALVLLAALTVVRIGDWRDDASLIKAGKRVNPKSKMLIWAEASLVNTSAVRALREGKGELGVPLAQRAGELYDLYIRNARPDELIQVRVETADLLYELGDWSLRHDPGRKFRVAYSRSLENYLEAWKLQRAGAGRVIEKEVVHVAGRVVDLALKLATPANPNVGRTILVGLECMSFLEQEHGADLTFQRAQLRFVDSVVIRARDPARARAGFDAVLALLDEVDSRKGAWTTYLRAQATFYRAILKDLGLSRLGLEQAVELYRLAARQAARESPGFEPQCLLQAAQALLIAGAEFKLKRTLEEALRLLDYLGKQRLDSEQADRRRNLTNRVRTALEKIK
jgi:hypothetical protein